MIPAGPFPFKMFYDSKVPGRGKRTKNGGVLLIPVSDLYYFSVTKRKKKALVVHFPYKP